MGMTAHLTAVCVRRSSPMDERHHEDTMASIQLHVYMCIDEIKRLVNRRVVLYL